MTLATIACLASALASVEAIDIDQSRRLSPEDDARKNEGSYVTGLPLAAFDPNAGFGAGARAYFYWNGERSDPLFSYTPYLHRIFLQGFWTTRALQFHWLDYDAPYFLSTPFRLRSQLIYERNKNRNYFSTGERAMAPLSSPATGRVYGRMPAYDASITTIDDNGQSFAYYDRFDFTRPIWFVSVERSLLSGRLRPLFGFAFSHSTINDYSGDRIDVAIDQTTRKATSGPTRLAGDCALGVQVGCSGGWDNMLRLGLAFDTRDFEPDPNRGVFIDAALDLASSLLGSEYDYARFLLSGRVYYSPMPDLADLVLALRATYQVQTKDTPFFSMDILPFTEDPRSGLGGLRTMRGFKQNRFVGPVMALVNAEVRWTFGHAKLLGQNFAFLLAPFFDVGRVYDRVQDTSFEDMRPSYGAGARIAWNQATLIIVDYGKSKEDSGLYINFNHIF